MTLEATINNAIKNGNSILENGIGTIYASRKQLAKMDKHSDKQEKERLQLAHKMLGHLEKRHEQGEVRFYDGNDKYAILSSRTSKALWFVKRKDGWYAA